MIAVDHKHSFVHILVKFLPNRRSNLDCLITFRIQSRRISSRQLTIFMAEKLFLGPQFHATGAFLIAESIPKVHLFNLVNIRGRSILSGRPTSIRSLGTDSVPQT